jgi:hypothetical protein
MSNTIVEQGILPSKGKIYDVEINPEIEVRSMTTDDEMKRLGYSKNAYKLLCEVIDDCITKKDPNLRAYDMWMPDFQYVMFKVRSATYGDHCKIRCTCPTCKSAIDTSVLLSSIIPEEITVPKKREILLPKSNVMVTFNFETPRIYDRIEARKREINQKYAETNHYNISLLVELEAYIKTVDNEELLEGDLNRFIKTLPMYDTNLLIQRIKEFNRTIDETNLVTIECPKCHEEFTTPFIVTSEFFRPTV